MSVTATTRMFIEAAEAPARVAAQIAGLAPVLRPLGERLRASPPRTVVTVARGSSDNAATFARYLIETRLEILTASMAPSVASVYAAAPDMTGTLCLVLSQSGRSPDLLAAAAAAKTAGALVVALVNDAASPLAGLADIVVPLGAGAETSVAATKSFICTLTAITLLVAHWSGDAALIDAVDALPDALAAAWDADWRAALPLLTGARHLYVIGRGPGFGIAQEAALKFKETCGLHAEAFSSAEVRHGPMTLAGPGFPVFAFMPDDETRPGVEAAVRAFREQGAPVIVAGGEGGNCGEDTIVLPVAPSHPLLTPIVQVQSFYRLVEELSRARGFAPDAPQYLAKVTRTL